MRFLIVVCALFIAGVACAGHVTSHVLVVGSEQDYPPFAIGKTDEIADGFTVDLWKAIAQDAGLHYSLRVLPFHELLKEFKDGKIDVLINLAQSAERSKFADFTVPHVTVHGAAFIRSGTQGIHGAQDLQGKSIIAVEDDIAHEYAISQGWQSNLTLVPTAADGLRLLAAGQHDAMFVSKLVGMQTLQQLELTNITALPFTAGATQKFSFAVKKGNADLLALLNEGLALSKSSGTYDTLYHKWFSIIEDREPTLADMLKYLLPLLAVFAGYVGFSYFRQRNALLQLAESHHMLQTVIETIPLRVFWKDRESRFLGCNTLLAQDAGKNSVAEIIGKLDSDFSWGEHAALYRADDLAVIDSGKAKLAYDEPMVTPDGQQIWLRTSKVPLRNLRQQVIGILGIFDDVTEVKHAQEQMLLASMVYENSSESMMVTNAEGNIITINPAFTKITGYTLDEVQNQNSRILNSGRHDKAFFQEMWHTINTTGTWQGEIWDKRKNGEIYPKRLTINTTFNADGTPYRRVALFSDITAKKESEKLIWQQANFDSLTGLPNRRMFHDRLAHEIKKAHRGERRLALLFIDLDHFKEINDSLGHDKGDVLLIEAARRLQACVRESDTVARLGGDEFTILLGEVDDLRSVDRIAHDILNSMDAPFPLAGEMAYVSASIGITLYPEDATDTDALLKNADQAMYAAKHQGRNRFSYFTQSMDEAAKTRMRIGNDLRSALAEKQFWVAYQPIVALATGNIHKAEALLRWQHPTRGLVSPAEFIPLAEETGLIIDIGNWVFQQAANQVTRWRMSHAANFQISVNKSPVQFLNNNINVKGWLEHMQDMDLPQQSIVIEITEGLLLHAESIVAEKLIKFSQAGMQVAIDDFGTGYSSLAYLKKFDIDYLKIDQSFVTNLAPGSTDYTLCEAIIVMAHKLGIEVIAEGIETRAQLDLLKTAGCDYGQGYYFSRPVAADELDVLLSKGLQPS